MEAFEQRIRENLLARPPEWHVRAMQLKEEIRTMYEERRKKAAMLAWIGTGIGLFLMLVVGVPPLLFGCITGQAAIAVAGAMMFLFGDGWITGSKLLYWTWQTRLQLERDVKEMHADLLDLVKRFDQLESVVARKDPAQ